MLKMVGLALLVIAFWVGHGGAAEAASFSCNGVTAPRLLAICADPQLSETDSQVVALFTKAADQLSPAGKAALLAGQRAWVDYLDLVCPTPKLVGATLRACLKDVYDQRVRDLQRASVQIGPLVFMRVDQYSMTRLTRSAGDYDYGYATHHVSYPQIDQPRDAATAAWNAAARPPEYAMTCDIGDGDTWTDYQLGLATRHLVSMVWISSEYCHGMPHASFAVHAETKQLSTALPVLHPENLFKAGTPWRARLTTLIAARIAQAADAQNVTLDAKHVTEAIERITSNADRWLLLPAGLGIFFSNYELAGYDFAPEVTIPWADMRPYMGFDPTTP